MSHELSYIASEIIQAFPVNIRVSSVVSPDTISECTTNFFHIGRTEKKNKGHYFSASKHRSYVWSWVVGLILRKYDEWHFMIMRWLKCEFIVTNLQHTCYKGLLTFPIKVTTEGGRCPFLWNGTGNCHVRLSREEF